MRFGIAVLLLACFFLGSCGGKKKPTKKRDIDLSLGKTVNVDRKGDIVERYDLNGDKHPDVIKVYRMVGKPGNQKKVLVRVMLDVNFDKKIDIWRYYVNGELRKVEMDLDFDGKVDSITHYQNGQVVLKEMDLEFDEKMDVWKYYKKGRLIRVERDTTGNGKVDLWMYYGPDGNIERVGQDKDGDGKIDHWETPKKTKK